MQKKRVLILDLYLFDIEGNIAAVDRKEDDPILVNTLSMIILPLPIGHHPIKYLKEYIAKKSLHLLKIEILPALFLNTFESEKEYEYLVTSYKATVDVSTSIDGDKENQNIHWMSFADFCNHPKLMPEFKTNNFGKILAGESMFYTGHYNDLDQSNQVLKWNEV